MPLVLSPRSSYRPSGATRLRGGGWNPSQGRYSPLWDVHLAQWTATAISAGLNRRQRDWGDIENLVSHGFVTGPGGAAFGRAGFIVDCPIASMR